MKNIIVTLSFVCLLFGCKSKKKLKLNNDTIELSQIIDAHNNNTLKFTTFKARAKSLYETQSDKQNFSINFRIQKDQKIWMSFSAKSIPVAKALITTDSIFFYEKLKKTYFKEDFKFLAKILGIDVNYNQVENLFFGKSINKLNKKDYTIDKYETSYLVKPKKTTEIEEIYLLNTIHALLNSQQLTSETNKRLLQADYTEYQEIDKKLTPKSVKFYAVDDGKQNTLNLEFNSVTLNEELRFPFKIPSGYSIISFE